MPMLLFVFKGGMLAGHGVHKIGGTHGVPPLSGKMGEKTGFGTGELNGRTSGVGSIVFLNGVRGA